MIVCLSALKPADGRKGKDCSSEFSRKATEDAVAKGAPGRKGLPSKDFRINEKNRARVDFRLTDRQERLGDILLQIS